MTYIRDTHAEPVVYPCGTGILPVNHGRDAHATRRSTSASRNSLLMLLLTLLGAACTRIGPDEIGVRTRNFAPGEGIVQADQRPGYHRFLWPLDSWHRFPSTVQTLRFAPQRDMLERTAGPIEITSADGDRVALSVEMLVRIADDSAHRVLQDSGSGDRFLDVARGLGVDAARAFFGRLRTEEFYDVERRETARREIIEQLGPRLDSRHMELVAFLVEGVEFGPNYEALIRAKKVADQQVELERSRSRAAEARGRVEMIRTETEIRLRAMQKEAEIAMLEIGTDANLRIGGLNAEAEQYTSQRRADADRYRGLKEAESTRVTKTAEAESIRLRNEALTGSGGRNLVAMETVKGLNLPQMNIASDGYPWLSPREMVTRFGGDAATDSDGEAP